MDAMREQPLKAGKVDQVMEEVRRRISVRRLTPGARLPSIRAMAEAAGVAKSTVVEAYDRLGAEGVVASRRGSGFFVAGRPAPVALSEVEPRGDRDLDPFWVSRMALDAPQDAMKPGSGWLPADWMPEAQLRRAIRGFSRADAADLAYYGTPIGHPPLRKLLARILAERGIYAAPSQIVLTESGTQAIDLVCRLLLEPGDTVLVDDPCYFNFQAILKSHRARLVGVPYTPSGPHPDVFERMAAEHRPRLYVTNSLLQNPTGAMLSPIVAHRVLKAAERFDFAVVEDYAFADFEPDPMPRLAAFDGLDRVVHIGTFSKTLSASVRCGYIAARPDWIEPLVDFKIATSFAGGRFAPSIVHAALTDGGYRKHVERLRDRLARSMTAVDGRLRGLGIVPWMEPRSGLFVWADLPDGLDAAAVARAALPLGLVLAPGNAFSLSGSARCKMRFNVAQMGDPRVYALLESAMAKAAAGAS